MNNKSIPGSRILLVEDEESMAVGLEYNLTEEGHRVTRAEDGAQALDLFSKQEFDLIILDIMLPFKDGFEVARVIRKTSPQMPILMLTARSDARDRIKGLEFGADDYMTKPFHLKELLLRVRRMLQRKAWYKKVTAEQPVYGFGENHVNFETLECRSGTRAFQMTALEAMVLKYLINHTGRIVSRKELLENVWQVSAEVETRTVDNFIMRLRRHFEKNPSRPRHILSVRGAGYQFDED